MDFIIGLYALCCIWTALHLIMYMALDETLSKEFMFLLIFCLPVGLCLVIWCAIVSIVVTLRSYISIKK